MPSTTADFCAAMLDATARPLSPGVSRAARRTLLNVLGTAVSAAGSPAATALLRAAAGQGSVGVGVGQVPVPGLARTLDPYWAALVIGTAAHLDDFDDTHLATVIHPGASALAAVVSLAPETTPSGAAFLAAFAVGCEAQLRIGNAISPAHYDHGWHITGTCGVFGAAVAASALLGLDTEAAGRALALAATMTAGHREAFGSMTKPLHAGKAAANGVLAARLAAAGLAGPADPLGPGGVLEVLSASVDRSALRASAAPPVTTATTSAPRPSTAPWADSTASAPRPSTASRPPTTAPCPSTSPRPSTTAPCPSTAPSTTTLRPVPWELELNTFKTYPCGVVAHPAMDAAIIASARIDTAEVTGITLRCNPLVPELMGLAQPEDGLRSRFSARHGVAVGLCYGRAGLAEFSDEAATAPAVARLRGLITLEPDPAIARDAAVLLIGLRSDDPVVIRVDHTRGSAARPLTDDELLAKVAALVAPVLGDADRLRAAVDGLPGAPDLSELFAAIRPEQS